MPTTRCADDDGDVTDTPGFFAGDRGWKAVLAGALSVLVAAVVVLVARGGDPATADTYVTSAHRAVVVLADGTTKPAMQGMRVPAGGRVQTASDGGATLSTAGRDVYLGREATLAVRDGVRQELRQGDAMVDSRNGPRLELGTPAGAVHVASGALARVEERALLRLGVFEGTATLTAAGRRVTTTVHALHQSKAAYGGVGQTPKALALADDAWERRLAPGLVNADLDLRALAKGLDGADGVAVIQSVSTRMHAVPAFSADRGEQALALAVAQASPHKDKVATLREVQSDRASGGSWGVVAALASARVSTVSGVLNSALAPDEGSPPAQAGGGPDLGGLLGGSTGGGSTGGSTGGTTGGSTGSSTGGPRPTPTRSTPPTRPSTSPPPSGPVDSVLDTVSRLLASPTPGSVTPSPSPILQIGPIRIG